MESMTSTTPDPAPPAEAPKQQPGTAQARPRAVGRLLLIGYAAAVGIAAVYALTVLSPAVPTPATATVVAQLVGYFTAALAGSACLGALVMVIITAQPDDRGVVDPTAFRAHLVIERLSPLWLVAALTMVVVQAAVDSGVAAARLLVSGRLPDALGASESARAWVVVTVCATVLAITSRLVLRWEWHLPLMIPAVVGIVAVPVSGDAGQGPDHDYATSSVIVFALAIAVWAGIKIAGAAAPPESAVRRRVLIVEVAAGATALVYGALLLLLRAGIGGLIGSDYGILGLLAAAVLLAATVNSAYALRADRTSSGPGGAIAAMATLVALSAMTIQTSPGCSMASRPSGMSSSAMSCPVRPRRCGCRPSGDSTPSSVLQRCYWPAFTCSGCCACAAGMCTGRSAARSPGSPGARRCCSRPGRASAPTGRRCSACTWSST